MHGPSSVQRRDSLEAGYVVDKRTVRETGRLDTITV